MKTISEEERAKMNEHLHSEIVESMKQGDTTVLFEIIERMNNTDVYYSLSDEAQEKVQFTK